MKKPSDPRPMVIAKNDLFRMRNRISSVLAGRVFMSFASMIDAERRDGEYCLRPETIIGTSILGGKEYKALKRASDELSKLRLEYDNGKNHFLFLTVFYKIEFRDGLLHARIHEDLLPFFQIAHERLGGFTQISLRQYMSFQSAYTQKMFTLLKSYEHGLRTGCVRIELEELHEILGTPDSLRTSFADFRKRVLAPSEEDIVKAGLLYTWVPVVQGRRVVEIEFLFGKVRDENTPKTAPLIRVQGKSFEKEEARRTRRREAYRKRKVIDVQATPVQDPAPDPRAAAPAAMTAEQEAQREQLKKIVRRRKAAPAQEPETTLANSEKAPGRARPKKSSTAGGGAKQLFDGPAEAAVAGSMGGEGVAALLGEDATVKKTKKDKKAKADDDGKGKKGKKSKKKAKKPEPVQLTLV